MAIDPNIVQDGDLNTRYLITCPDTRKLKASKTAALVGETGKKIF